MATPPTPGFLIKNKVSVFRQLAGYSIPDMRDTGSGSPGKAEQERRIRLHRSPFSEASLLSLADGLV